LTGLKNPPDVPPDYFEDFFVSAKSWMDDKKKVGQKDDKMNYPSLAKLKTNSKFIRYDKE